MILDEHVKSILDDKLDKYKTNSFTALIYNELEIDTIELSLNLRLERLFDSMHNFTNDLRYILNNITI